MTILCFHTIEPDWDSTLAIPNDDFAEQCAWIARHRNVVPLDAALGRLDRRCRLRGSASALTFDDGWRGVYDHAWPILREHRLPFTIFVIAETLQNSSHATDWVERPPDKPLEFLTLDQVREIRQLALCYHRIDDVPGSAINTDNHNRATFKISDL